ncbi:MATE family efflux transporter [Parendozoicomonas haliclonae]|uniref:Multidrug-efflux transporter n=1 Tax=Parendozoicomonas haliclonae TaxID=1960125 RepID=A0A1X7AJM2_9GAMM|nr:MATE family efflux transporter [Parendozoicomonas haliclonae]SMA46710.1 Multidrug resistance protein NorM [Parendozoicomonas haliclonae]
MSPFARVLHPDSKDFLRRLWHLAVPVSIQAMMFSILGLIDIVMVGHLGESAVAAVGLGNRIFFFNLILTAALGGGMSVLASQFIGAGDEGGLRRTLCQALVSAVLMNLPFILAYLFVPEWLLGLASSDATLLDQAVTYMMITGPSIFCTAVVVPIEAALRASGDTKTPTWVGFYAIVVNVILNYVLIFGEFGFPEMGVAGSAWGTTLSRLFQTLVLAVFIYRQKRHLIPSAEDIAKASQKKEIQRYLGVALPVLLQDGLWAFGVVLYNVIYARIGVDELAVMSAVSSIEGILMSLFIGFGIGCSIMLGQELGAKRFDRAWVQGVTVMGIAPLVALLIGALLIVFRTSIVSLFGQFDAETQSLADTVMVISGLALFIRVINFTGIIGLLRSGGDVRYSAVLNIIGMWGFGVPMALCGAFIFKLPLYWVFVCALSEEIVKMFMVVWRIHSKRWLKNLVADPVDELMEVHKAA